MKWFTKLRNGRAVTAGALTVLALLAITAPEARAYLTTGGATVYNKVTVTYASGTVTDLAISSSTSITVTTLAVVPTLTVDTQTASILSGDTTTYTYTIKANANGTDTYTVSVDASSSDANMSTANADSLASTPITLWAGYAIGSGSDGGGNYITVPGGSTLGTGVNPLAAGATLMLTVGGAPDQTYQVASVSHGQAKTDLVNETLGKIYLTALNGSPAITGANVTAGTQVGEYTTFQNTVTAGKVNIDPLVPGIVDGTHVTQLHVVTTAKGPGSEAAATTLEYTTTNGTDVTTTTILAPKLSIVKASRNITANPASSFATTGVTARPGEILEYRITVKNLHTVNSASIANANVVDNLPGYTTLVSGSVKYGLNTTSPATAVADGALLGVAGVSGGYDIPDVLHGGAQAGPGPGLADYATIIYQVTVN